jgi:hypothetical protein
LLCHDLEFASREDAMAGIRLVDQTQSESTDKKICAGLQQRLGMAPSAIWNEIIEKPHLVTNERIKGELFTCICSLCGQVFLPVDDGGPKEPMAELWRTFIEHVRELHGEERTI